MPSLSFTRKEKCVEYNYSIDVVNLSKPETVKDLGVVFDPKLNFGRHIEMITNNAYRSLGYIYRFSKDLRLDSTLLKLHTLT